VTGLITSRDLVNKYNTETLAEESKNPLVVQTGD